MISPRITDPIPSAMNETEPLTRNKTASASPPPKTAGINPSRGMRKFLKYHPMNKKISTIATPRDRIISRFIWMALQTAVAA